MFKLKLFGGASLEVEDEPLHGRVVQRRRLAVLALLASSRGRPVSRDKLIAYLWPESDTSQARHSLSDSVHVIRKALGEEAIHAEGDELRLNPEVVSCDASEYEAALEADELERAVSLYSGPFLDGFYIGGDALEFEGWAAHERERLARAYGGTLERLAESAAAAGDAQRASEWWHRLCDHEPDNSRAVLGLMTALAAVGDRAGALRKAGEHAEHLKNEYGAEPDPTVTALVRRLQVEPTPWAPPRVASAGVDRGSAEADLPRARLKLGERSVATVLFTDIVGSTERAAELRDTGWRDLKQKHDRRVRRELRRFGGHEVNTAGDSFVATFERPAWAIACAAAIRASVRELGLEIRAGLHMGEVEEAHGEAGGLALHIGARVAAEAGGGEILVSRSVHDALAGSDFDFEDRGARVLKGVPGEWRLFAVTNVPEGATETLPGRLRRALTPRRVLVEGAAWRMIAIVGVALAGSVLTYLLMRDGGLDLVADQASASGAAPGIAVLPFRIVGDELAEWREGMVDLLSTSLDGVVRLRTIDSRTVLTKWNEEFGGDSLPDFGRLLAVARGTGAKYAVVGRAVSIGKSVRLSADVYDLGGRGRIGLATVEGVPDSLFQLVDRLSIDLVRVILVEEGSERSLIDLASITTDSLSALKVYLEGMELYRGSDYRGAFQRYERATEIDSTFALAHYMQGLAVGWGGFEEISPFLEKAARHSDRLPRREALVVRGILALHSGSLESQELVEQAVRRYPEDHNTKAALAEVYYHLGPQLLVEATAGDSAWENAVQIDSTVASDYQHLIDNAFGLHASAERARRFVAAYERLAPNSREAPLYRLGFQLAFGDADDRRAGWHTISTLPGPNARFVARNLLWHPSLLALGEAVVVSVSPSDPGRASQLAMVRFGRGRVEGALEELSRPEVDQDLTLALLYLASTWGMPIPEGGIQEVLAGLDLAGASPEAAFFAGAFAVDRNRPRDVKAARERLASLADSLRRSGDPYGAGFPAGAEKALLAYERWRRGGQPSEAFGTLVDAQREATGFLGTPPLANSAIRRWLAQLAIELGDLAAAERYLHSFYGLREPFTTSADFELARVLDRQARYAEAEQRYARFLAAWNAADRTLEDRVEYARGRLEAIRGERARRD